MKSGNKNCEKVYDRFETMFQINKKKIRLLLNDGIALHKFKLFKSSEGIFNYILLHLPFDHGYTVLSYLTIILRGLINKCFLSIF